MRTFLKVWLSIALIAIVFGIGILIVAVGSGASLNDIPTYSLNESYDDVKNLDMEIGFGEVKIVEGNEFSINAKNLLDEGFESYVKDGTWVIRENREDYLNFFGMRFSVPQIAHINENFSPKITITIPKDFAADNIVLDVRAGYVEAEEITAKSGEFTVEAGVLRIDQLLISEESKYNVGAGEMVLNDIIANDVTVDCGVGNILINGTITGNNDITCGVGRVELQLEGNEDDYSFELQSGIGNVVINNNSYHNVTNKIIRNSNAKNNFDLDCGIGNITVEFN